jgi:thymidylate synthase (FAD)
MGTVTVLDTTTLNPITLMGERAGVCWGGDISDSKKNYKRGLSCLKSNHGRVLEYVNVELIIDGYSSKVMREWYTHIGGMPSRLQSSTRYINYDNFETVIPKSVKSNNSALCVWEECIETIRDSIKTLKDLGIPNEDANGLLTLSTTTRVVDKRNLRNYIDMSGNRMCTRAYWEYRDLFDDICAELSKLSDEWKYIVDTYFKPKCEKLGYCPEDNGCGIYPNN